MMENKKKDCDNCIFRSLNHEMYLQKLKIISISSFDDRRCFESNIERKH